MKESCLSPIPNVIEQPFLDIDVKFFAAPGIISKYLYPRCYKAIFRVFLKHPLFPAFLPSITDVDAVCQRELNLSEFKELYSEDFLRAYEQADEECPPDKATSGNK